MHNENHIIAPKIISRLEKTAKHFWWVIFFALLCLFMYEQGQKAIRIEYHSLLHKHDVLIQQKKQALSKKESMTREINSQSDHDWVELTLMKGLGMVPEKQTKVFLSD